MSERLPYQGVRLPFKAQGPGPVTLLEKENTMRHAARKNSKPKVTKPGRLCAADFATLTFLSASMLSALLQMAHILGSFKSNQDAVMRQAKETLENLLSQVDALKKYGSTLIARDGKRKSSHESTTHKRPAHKSA